jgi:hypothetical protein
VSVGRTVADFSRVHFDSAGAFTSDGRMKPDVVAPGSALTLANDDWEGAAADWDNGLNGTSFAAPHVAGLMAQMLEAGATRNLSTDPLVIKAAILNSADKSVLDKNLNPWQPATMIDMAGVATALQPLDTDSGAGQIHGLFAAEQYLAGKMTPGLVDPVGWDLHSVGNGQFVDYTIDPALIAGSSLTATLTWYRHVGRFDDGNGLVDANDGFFLQQSLSNLNLQVLRNGNLIAESISAVDNVEHLFLDLDRSARYTLRVFGAGIFGESEQFALAWHGLPAPEPGSVSLAAFAASAWFLFGKRHRTSLMPAIALVSRNLRPRLDNWISHV